MNAKFEAMNPKTTFGKWMYSKMMEQNLNCTDVANKLHITKQNVAYHVAGHHLPNYPFVVAYCSILGDDPELIWRLVEQDKNES